ncbi:hypothetical protein BCU32_015640 [Vibrio lentus]|uniref:hypothetical protein n=1 Tax=Vibrio lentus TaxID=136468 RepID=UPI000C84DA53|nr:hypothetical protein [Vibrio lentus]PMJ01955.1 hypothetical protein BCU32_06345 [Vibrio lentus]
MTKWFMLILTVAINTALGGCGDRGDSGSTTNGISSPSQAPESELEPEPATIIHPPTLNSVDAFKDIVVPNDFDWRGSKTLTITVDITSSFSLRDGKQRCIRGSHIIDLYNTSDPKNPVHYYTGLSDRHGHLTDVFTFPAHWKSLNIIANVNGQKCTSTYASDELETVLIVSCGIVLEED